MEDAKSRLTYYDVKRRVPNSRLTCCDAIVQDGQKQELQHAQQEVLALRVRVKQLESDTHSTSSLEQRHLSLQQVLC